VQVCCYGVTSSEALFFRTWIGRSAKTPRSDHRLEEGVLREVSAYSTICPEQASAIQEGWSPRCPMQCRWKCTVGSMPRFFGKTYFLPLSPRGRAASHHLCQWFNFSPPLPDTEMSDSAMPRTSARFSSTRPQAPHSSPLKLAGAFSLIRSARNTARHAREISTQNNRPHIAMSYQPSFAWKASPRAHRRRFARPPLVL